jgi:hypothetical protein
MAATWIKVWRVSASGETLSEWEASHAVNGGVIVRNRRNGMYRYRSGTDFDLWYGETPEGAVNKYIARMQAGVERAREELQLAEQYLVNGEKLRQQINAPVVDMSHFFSCADGFDDEEEKR